MQTIRVRWAWRIRVPSALASKMIFLVAGVWMSLGVLQQLLHDAPHQSIDYSWNPWDESMDSKMYRSPKNTPIDYALIKDDTKYPEWDPTYLQKLLESPTTVCKHLTSLGGSYECKNCHTCKKDGNKFVCFDNDVRPIPGNCLIYSFGVGGELSWDNAMLKFNCTVYAFDMTSEWENGILHEGFHFLNVGLHAVNYDAQLNMTNGDARDPNFREKMGFFRTLSAIQDILGHKERLIDILKLDVEYTEWDIFEAIFSNTENSKVLKNVKQIALEIHLDDFKKPSAADRVAGGRRVENILREMFAHGFHLTHTELNTASQTHAEVRGHIFPLFRESLFLHRP